MEFKNLKELEKHQMHLAHRVLQQENEIQSTQRKLVSPIKEYQKRQLTMKLHINQLMYTAQASLAGFKVYKMVRNFIDEIKENKKNKKQKDQDNTSKSNHTNKKQPHLLETILTALVQLTEKRQ